MTLSDECIERYVHANTNELLLNPPRGFVGDIKELVREVKARQKAKHKLPTWVAQGGIRVPSLLAVEQSSSEATAHYKARLFKGEHLTDLTGGLGVDTWAFSQVFKQVQYVEKDPKKAAFFEQNMRCLGRNNIEVFAQSAESFLASSQLRPDFYYIDPHRRDDQKEKVFQLEACQPNLLDILPQIQASQGQLLLKASPILDIQLASRQLRGLCAVYIIEWKQEVRELLFHLDFRSPSTSIALIVANLDLSSESHTTLDAQYISGPTSYHLPEKYLYLPSAGHLKAGLFNWLIREYPIRKIAANTHLYTSNIHVPEFPGRCWQVLANQPTKKQIHKTDLHAISRNHPLTANQLTAKFQLTPKGDRYLLAFRDAHDRPRMLVGLRC